MPQGSIFFLESLFWVKTNTICKETGESYGGWNEHKVWWILCLASSKHYCATRLKQFQDFMAAGF